jgi:hypothetical protein
VVDALLTDETGPSTVILSRSFSYKDDIGIPYEKATVIIEDDQGESTILDEITPGIYQTDSTTFQGQIGKSYRLVVRTAEGNTFESDWELMKAAPPIESIRAAFQERLPDDPDSNPIPGIQFYLNTKDGENKTKYYRWDYVETYQYYLPYPPYIRVEFSDNPGNGQDQILLNIGNDFEGTRCWKTEKSKELIFATTESLSQDIIRDFPFLYINNTTPRLSFRHSVLVRQFAISESYFKYLKKLEETNETTGSLFDPIPNEVFGNIKSSDGKNIPVFGYFNVAGVSEKRFFLARQDLDEKFSVNLGPKCVTDTIDLDFRTLNRRVNFSGMVLYDYHYSLFGDPIAFILTDRVCTSCAVNDATNKQPDFW